MLNPFNSTSYTTEQIRLLQDALSQHSCIVWHGEFAVDEEIATLIPWYTPNTQLSLLTTLYQQQPYDIIYTLDARDLVRDKQLRQKYCSFDKYTITQIKHMSKTIWANIIVHIALPDDDFVPPHVREYSDQLTTLWYTTIQSTPSKPYHHTSDHPTLIGSYDLIPHSDHIIISWHDHKAQYSLHPLHQDITHPLTLASYALYENISSLTDNLCIISKYIVWSPDDYRDLVHTYITNRIRFYEKLVISWHAEPEEVDYCQELLKYF